MSTKKSESEILAPGHKIALTDGRTPNIRELTFAESMEALRIPGAAEFFASLATDPAPETTGAILRVAGKHPAWWADFLELVADLDGAAIADLNGRDGMMVSIAAIGENVGFFGLGVMTAVVTPKVTSSTSSPSSSATDTRTPSA